MNTVFGPGVLRGTAAAPSSKSEAHRRLICAALTHGTTSFTGLTGSEDVTATIRCIEAMGARTEQRGDELLVTGGAKKPELLPLYDCGESGSTLRFFVPIALAVTGGGIFRMRGRLGSRPMDVYRDLFVPKGVTWAMREGVDGTAELRVVGRLEPGFYELPGNVSSQFVSGLLFALPLLDRPSTLTVTPPVESVSYIGMTVRALRSSGVTLEDAGEASWRIPGRQSYQAVGGALHGDWSQTAVLLAGGALGGDVTVTGLSDDDGQGDRAILDCLRALGANVEAKDGTVRCSGGQLRGVTLDMRDCPDIAPVVALLCAVAEGKSTLNGCGRLRLKESNRLEATARILRTLGASARVEWDCLRISGGASLKGNLEVDAVHDHRMVMLASLAALLADGPVTVKDTEALAKSWPGYLDTYRALGGVAE